MNIQKFFRIIATAFLILTASILANTASATTIWYVTWHHVGGGQDNGWWIKLSEANKYKVIWDTGINGYLDIMRRTNNTFGGLISHLTNGDNCYINGSISGTALSGNYFCSLGGTGTFSGEIRQEMKNRYHHK